MKTKSRTLAIHCALWTIACACATDVACAQESLIGGYDLEEWTPANQSGNRTQRIIEFVQNGQAIESWTELLTIQTLKMPRKPPAVDALVAAAADTVIKRCPGKVTSNVIAREESASTVKSVLFEWSVKDCPPDADQHEVARILYGKFNIFRIAYVAKTSLLEPEKREKWIAKLNEAEIGDIGR